VGFRRSPCSAKPGAVAGWHASSVFARRLAANTRIDGTNSSGHKEEQNEVQQEQYEEQNP
jgi:hypothetical protein